MEADLFNVVCLMMVILSGCREPAPAGGPVTGPSGPVLQSIAIRPDHATMFSGGNELFQAVGTWSNGASGPVNASFSATGGAVTPSGLYTAGSAVGTYRVIATAAASPLADTAEVTIAQAPPPGSYQAIFAKDWSSYPDKAALVGVIGVDGQTNRLDPVLPATDFFDLVPDPVFGKVVRYLGGPQLNTYPVVLTAKVAGVAGNDYRLETSPASDGVFNHRKWTIKNHPTNPTVTEVYDNQTRSTLAGALSGSALVTLGPMNTGYTLLPGGPNPPNSQTNTYAFSSGAASVAARLQMVDNVQGRTATHSQGFGATPLSHVWTRQFIRFSPNWTTIGAVGGEGAPSHKMIFLLYAAPGGRHEWTSDGVRGLLHTFGGPSLPVEQGLLPITNVSPPPGQGLLDAYPMMRVPCGIVGTPCGDGDGEWYEIVFHHEIDGLRCEGTIYVRRYTTRGLVNPQPWKIHGYYRVLGPGGVWPLIQNYKMGVNRNRQWDETMSIDWGPYEIVDGSKYPNPWGLPGG